ncbi:MAG TPA: hypothetical protein VGO55_03155 [Allosphingosinicella sp.]|jgi:hypothetical protein|nr:hypothetical protein [Allosphingosinicella sp.]
MAWVQADLDRIEAAIASNVRSVTYADGRKVEYHNLDQMLAVRRVISAQLQMAAESAAGIVRRRFAAFRSGT